MLKITKIKNFLSKNVLSLIVVYKILIAQLNTYKAQLRYIFILLLFPFDSIALLTYFP